MIGIDIIPRYCGVCCDSIYYARKANYWHNCPVCKSVAIVIVVKIKEAVPLILLNNAQEYSRITRTDQDPSYSVFHCTNRHMSHNNIMSSIQHLTQIPYLVTLHVFITRSGFLARTGADSCWHVLVPLAQQRPNQESRTNIGRWLCRLGLV